jgi:hypothetical protein
MKSKKTKQVKTMSKEKLSIEELERMSQSKYIGTFELRDFVDKKLGDEKKHKIIVDVCDGMAVCHDYKGKELLLTYPKLDFVNKTDLADKIRTSLGYDENQKLTIVDVMVTCFTLNVY